MSTESPRLGHTLGLTALVGLYVWTTAALFLGYSSLVGFSSTTNADWAMITLMVALPATLLCLLIGQVLTRWYTPTIGQIMRDRLLWGVIIATVWLTFRNLSGTSTWWLDYIMFGLLQAWLWKPLLTSLPVAFLGSAGLSLLIYVLRSKLAISFGFTFFPATWVLGDYWHGFLLALVIAPLFGWLMYRKFREDVNEWADYMNPNQVRGLFSIIIGVIVVGLVGLTLYNHGRQNCG